jgi:hypothetical protein
MSVFGYTSRDFNSIKSDMLARAARVLPEWTERDSSDFGNMMVDLWAYAADVMHYYIDRAAGEAFIDTAQRRESLLAYARLFDYTPSSRTSARGTVTIANDTDTPYVIDRYFEFVARFDDRTYNVYATSPVTVEPNSIVGIEVAEGEVIRDEVLATRSAGEASQRYTLRVPGAVTTSINVAVFEDGITPVQYLRVLRLASANSGDRVFEADLLTDGTTDIVFGNALNGFVPFSGSRITATYVVSSGVDGNLPAGSVIAYKGVRPPNGITIEDSSSLSGGVNDESIESLKANIPATISTQYRAVTRSDFVNAALTVPGIAKASVSYIPNAGQGGSANAGSVSLYVQPFVTDFVNSASAGFVVPQETREEVERFVQPLAMLGVQVSCAETVTWDRIDLSVTAYITARAITTIITDRLTVALESLFDFDNVFFGQRLVLGEVYRTAIDVEGIDYVEINAFCREGNTGVEQQILVSPLELPKLGTLIVTPVGGISTSVS